MHTRALALTDEEHVRRFQETGDDSCFAELFMRHRKRVFFKCQAFFEDVDRAEDATQEVFLRAYRNMQRFQGGDFAAWLVRIASNVCIDEWRKGRRDPVTANSELIDKAAPVSIGSSVEVHHMVEKIWQEIMSLVPEQRRCLELKIDGHSYEETAARTGFSIDAVKSHLQNGRRMLWKRLEGARPQAK